jgi:hypothetical protein
VDLLGLHSIVLLSTRAIPDALASFEAVVVPAALLSAVANFRSLLS